MIRTAILSAAALVAAIAASPAVAKTCKQTLVTARQSGSGAAPQAEAAAWAQWAETVAQTLGRDWADRALAADRNTACKAEKTADAGSHWSCVVAARPCQN